MKKCSDIGNIPPRENIPSAGNLPTTLVIVAGLFTCVPKIILTDNLRQQKDQICYVGSVAAYPAVKEDGVEAAGVGRGGGDLSLRIRPPPATGCSPPPPKGGG
jgi:hypothetical protein